MSHVDDITARHLAKVVESSDDAIVSKDLNSIVTSWNPGAERIFGYTAAEIVGKSIRIIIPAHLQDEEDVVMARIRAGEKVDHYETIRQTKAGALITISLTVSPIKDDNGVIIGASKVARDVSDRVRLENELREHAENTQKLSAVGAVVASTLDRETIVQKVTDTATELTHAEFGAFFYNVRDQNSGDAYMLYALSGAPREAFSSFPHPRATALFGPTFRGESPVRIDDVLADPRYGKSAPYHGMPKRTPAGPQLPRGSGQRPRWPCDRRSVLRPLPTRVSSPSSTSVLALGTAAWASVALENARLYGEAQDANRMKDDFLAVLSHELRTPLNAILGYSRLLRGNVLSGEHLERGIETVERNARWLTQIVEDVLDVSRIVSGKIRLDVQAVNLASVIDNAIATIQPAADAKSVKLQTLIDPRVAPVSGDPDRLQQVVWNLLSNAVKFTPKGGRVQLRLERVNSHVEIIVSDTGVGIRKDFLPYVFERFRQGDSGPARKTGGLGLGLSIVRHIVEMHGGVVLAESAGEGEGSTFTVTLPIMIVQPTAARRPREHPLAEPQQALQGLSDLSGVHVLAIDDEEDSLGLLRVVLEAAGARVTTASSAAAALGTIESIRPDVLVADIGMPEMDGFELIKRVRAMASPHVRDLPAAALTAFARSEDRTKALQHGFEMHLAKPVDPGELVASVATLVRRSRISKA